MLKSAREWCEANVRSGFWSVGTLGCALPGGYELGDDYAEFALHFTEEGEADAFRARLSAEPLGVPPDDGCSVDVGMVSWPDGYGSVRQVTDMFPSERKWCVENSGWFNWRVETTSEAGQDRAGPRSYRTYFRFPDPSVAAGFSDWRARRVDHGILAAAVP